MSCMNLPKPDESQINKLKQKNSLLNTLENKGTQIAVVGDTSTGKSTTINFLLGFPVNFEASGIGTRRPCVICQEFDPKADKMHFKVAFTKGGQHHSRHYSDVAGVAAEVKEANTPSNEQYFDCILEQRRKDGTLLNEDLVFDEEPIYVTMCHKSFVYGLRLIDLPGLTSSCPAPMEIAKKYIQPGNVCVLVIGADNPANAQFPKLAEKMSACSKVIFMQNFAKSIIERVPDNLALIQKKFREQKCDELASSLMLYCTDYGFPKLPKYVEKGLWKEGEGQEDWIEMSGKVDDLANLREAMWSHATKLAAKLREEQPGTVTGNISAGIEEPLCELIKFQLQNIDGELEKLKEMVRADIQQKERAVNALRKEVKLLNDPPQWSGLLARAARVVSEFLDTTIEVRTANYEKIENGFNQKKVETFQGMTVQEEVQAGGKYDSWSGSEHVDKSIVAALEKCAKFKAAEKLLCLRSWVRLLDEFTAALAFNPMQMIKEQNRRNRMELFDLGATGLADKPEAVLRLVCEANSKAEPIRGQLMRFRDRLMCLVERDINYAMQVFACDETGEIREFLRIVGVGPDEEKAVGQALVQEIKDVILEQAKATITNCINGCKVFDSDGNVAKTRDGKEEYELGKGMIVRSDENALKPSGALHWLLPFKSHYLNGQIPWRNLKWTGEPTEGICPPEDAHTPAEEEVTSVEEDPAIMEELKKEIADNVKPGEAPTMNYTNAVNLRIYKLSTEMYNVELTPNTSQLRDYELEAMKLLKAMQAEVASFFSAAWLPMLQNLMDVDKIKDFVIDSTIKPELRKLGILDNLKIEEGYNYVLDLLAGRPGRDNINVTGYFYTSSYDDDGMMQTTQEELRDLETKMKDEKYRRFFQTRERPWNGGLDTAQYIDLLDSKSKASSSATGAFPANYDYSEACRASWKRICEEFLFLVLQLSVRSVTELELQLAVASAGSSLTASPQEIVGKLVLHRLRELGREAGTNFKDRLISVYDRDITNGLKEASKTVKIPEKCVSFGDHAEGDQFLKDTMLTYASNVIDRTLSELQDSFDQLVPFDWSSLNGRLPLARDLKGLRLKDWKKGEGGDAVAVDTPEEDIKEIWKAPIKTLWKLPSGESILDGKMNIGLEADKGDGTKPASPQRITCMQTVQDEAYSNLVTNGLEVITAQMTNPEYKRVPGDWDKKMAAPLFQTSALVIWKAMHCAAIDYCRPRLKKMLAQIYQVDAIRSMLTSAPFQSGKLDFRTMYKDTIQNKRDTLKDQEAKLERLHGVIDALNSGKELNNEGAVPVAFQLEAAQAELAEEREKAQQRATEYQAELEQVQKAAEEAQELAERKMKQGRILRKILHAGIGSATADAKEQARVAEIAKKYYAMDSLLSKYKLEIQEISIAGTCMKKEKVWFAGYWFKEEGWWGKDVSKLAAPKKMFVKPYQRLFETDSVDPTGGGRGYCSLTARDLSSELTEDLLYPLATFEIPPLFPWHEHVLAIECWKVPKGGIFKKGTDQKLCTVVIPLAHALKGKEEFTQDLSAFEFEDKVPFEVKAKGTSDNCESLTFKFDKGGMRLPADKASRDSAEADLGSRPEITVTIVQTFDEQDQPLLLLTDDPEFKPPPRT